MSAHAHRSWLPAPSGFMQILSFSIKHVGVGPIWGPLLIVRFLASSLCYPSNDKMTSDSALVAKLRTCEPKTTSDFSLELHSRPALLSR